MPIGGPSTYLFTIDEFLAHWQLVNTALGGTGLTLAGGYSRATLLTDRGKVDLKMTAANTAIDQTRGFSTDRDNKRAAIKERMRQFNQTVRGQIPGSLYVGLLPRIPTSRASQGRWQTALDEMTNCWTRINTDAPPPPGFTPPLILNGPYPLATYATDKTATLAAFTAVTTGFQNQEAAITDRDATMAPVKQKLIQYRLAVKGAFPAGHSLILSLPAVTPLPGSTPTPVNLTAVWNVADLESNLTWPPTTDPRVVSYEVRACFGTRYRTQDESVIGNVPLGTEHFESDQGLGSSGAFVNYKVFTQTATGNEKGSNTVKVTRP